MYLEHFQLKEPPFSLTPNTDFYCNLPSHEEALKTILFSLNDGDGFIKVIAEVGVGKTLLCRKLLNTLDGNFISCYIPNPDLSPNAFRKALAIELCIKVVEHANQHALLLSINEKLLEYHRDDKQVVLIIDEAQALSYDTLETIRLLTNLETESSKLMQIVLFGQPELGHKLRNPALRQLQQRIIYSHYIKPIGPEEIEMYFAKRLIAAGHATGVLFTKQARHLLYKKSCGIPRVLNTLCHKAMIAAYGRGDKMVDIKAVKQSVEDSFDTLETVRVVKRPWFGLMLAAVFALFGSLSYFVVHFAMR